MAPGGSGTKWWRGAMALVLAVGTASVCAADADAQATEDVYSFSITYSGDCKGLSTGELRRTPTSVTMWGSTEGPMQPVGSSPVNPDGSFTLAIAGTGFSMSGQFTTSGVTAEGTYSGGFGNPCPFKLTGTRVGGQAAPPSATATTVGGSTTTTVVKDEEFDPTATTPLTLGEVSGLLRRKGLTQQEINQFFERSRFKGSISAGSVLVNIASLQEKGGEAYEFGELAALGVEDGPLNALIPGVLDDDPETTAACFRLVRLAILRDL